MKDRGARRGGRGWLLMAALAVAFVWLHASSMNHYLDRVTGERFATQETGLARERIQHGLALDGMTWLRLSEDMVEQGDWRFRDTASDNAPEGRPVYWNSGWAWWLAGLGKVWAGWFDVPFGRGIEWSSGWAHVPVLFALMAVLGGWVARRWGWRSSVLLVVGMVGHRAFYEGFYPGNPDHHGVIAGCALGMILALFLGGAGWFARDGETASADDGGFLPQSETGVKRCLLASAAFGGVGMWFSAASMIPVIVAGAGVAVAGMLAFGRGMRAEGLCVSPAAWRLWGRAGAVVSLGFYLLENFPDRLGWRLEANHPLYGLAWLGGAECVALMLERLSDRRRQGRRRWWRWTAALLAGASPAVAVFAAGARVFVPADPFITAIYRYVSELDSLWVRMAALGYGYYLDYAGLHLALLAGAAGLWFLARIQAVRFLLFCLILLAGALMALGWWQNRWLLIAAGPLILLASFLPAAFSATGGGWRRAVMPLAVLVFVPMPWRMVKERWVVEQRHDVQAGEAMQLLYRDIARVLVTDAVDRDIVLLSSLDGSVSISYYANARSVGTLYWENAEGMRRTAALQTGADDAVVRDGLRRAGVTHVALVSIDDGIAEFVEGMHVLGEAASVRDAFATRLLEDRTAPLWLRPLPYAVPSQFSRLAPKVRLYAVDEDQPAAEAHYRHGLAAAARGAGDDALKYFWETTSLAPDMPAPWFRIGEVLLAKRNHAAACDAMIMGVRLLPGADRAAAYAEIASLFSRHGAEAEAARLRALASAAP